MLEEENIPPIEYSTLNSKLSTQSSSPHTNSNSIISKSRCLEQITNRTERSSLITPLQRINQKQNSSQQYGIIVNVPNILQQQQLEEKIIAAKQQINEIENKIEHYLNEQQMLIEYIKHLNEYLKQQNKKRKYQFNSEYFNGTEELKIVKGQLTRHDLQWVKLKKTMISQIQNTQKSISRSKQRLRSLSSSSIRYLNKNRKRTESVQNK